MRSQLGLHRRGRLMSDGTPPPGDVIIPPDPDPEPDTPDELEEVLASLGTHAELDAWVQEHEANLPERPADWSRMSRPNKRAWVQANYDFTAPDPVDPPDPDENDFDEDDGA